MPMILDAENNPTTIVSLKMPYFAKLIDETFHFNPIRTSDIGFKFIIKGEISDSVLTTPF